MNPHNLQYSKSCAKDYVEYFMRRRKCRTRKSGLQKSSMFSTNMVFKIMYFFSQQTEETKSEILPDHRHHQYKYTNGTSSHARRRVQVWPKSASNVGHFTFEAEILLVSVSLSLQHGDSNITRDTLSPCATSAASLVEIGQ
jgi:hypothetical protein